MTGPDPEFFTHLWASARRHHEHFTPDQLTAAPVQHFVLLTCMDARLDLFRIFGLELGDAHILRNAGGRVTDDALRSLIVSMHMLDTRNVLVVHHTGCGLLGQTNESLRERIGAATGADASTIDFHPIDDLAQSVRDDVDVVRSCALLPTDAVVHGAIYDVGSGELIPVC